MTLYYSILKDLTDCQMSRRTLMSKAGLVSEFWTFLEVKCPPQ